MPEMYVVMGPPCAGKSTFVEQMFGGANSYPKVDLFDFQENMYSVEDILESYNQCAAATISMIENGINEGQTHFVLEHTLLKEKRRPQFIEAIRSANQDIRIHFYVLNPSIETYKERLKKRGQNYSAEYEAEYILEVLEIPTYNEDIDYITLVTDEGLVKL